MIPIQLRLLLVLASLCALMIVIKNIKNQSLLTEDGVFWFVVGLVVFLCAVFPGAVVWMASLLGFISPANLVFLVVVALLIWKVFVSSVEISQLKMKVNSLTQELALHEYEHTHTQNEHCSPDASSNKESQ